MPWGRMYGGIGLVAPKRMGNEIVERRGSRDRRRRGMVGRGFGGKVLCKC